jgi:hypothetical protein
MASLLALATGDSRSAERQVSYDEIAAAPRTTDAVAPGEDAATAPPPGIADAAAGTEAAEEADDLASECRGFQVDRRWDDLERCADQLQPLDPTRAGELKARALEEARTAPRIAAVEAALRDRDLRRAEAELRQVWTDSLELPKLRRRYAAAEAQAIADLAAQLDRVKDSDCEEYTALLAKERATKPAHVLEAAAHRTRCTPPPCLADAYAEKGKQQYAAQQLAAALASYEAAYACRPSADWSAKAFVIACNLSHLPRARLHWRRLPLSMRTQALGVCVRNGISEGMLKAP